MTPIASAMTWARMVVLAGISACMVVEKVGDSGAPEATELPGYGAPEGHSEPDSPRPELADPASPSVDLHFSEEALSLQVVAGPDPAYLAILETGGCTAGACWTGEGCGEAYVGPDGEPWGPYCHAIVGSSLTLTWGGDPRALAVGETAFRFEHQGNMTFALRGAPAGEPGVPCFSWGDNPSAFPDCTPI